MALFVIFVFLKRILLYPLLFLSLLVKAQDKIYFLDGSCKTYKILEINDTELLVAPLSESGTPYVNSNEVILKKDVLLVEYKNGSIDIYNKSKTDLRYSANQNTNVKESNTRPPVSEITYSNFGSLNTLALCNADLAGFYEHLLPEKKLGVGLMASYNFNTTTTAANAFIDILKNAKKNYDIGLFANVYPGQMKKRTSFFFGIFIKYTSFNFNSVIEEKVPFSTSVNFKYVPSQGSQLATLITTGFQTTMTKNFFLKYFLGLGGYNLRGSYKEQFNYAMNTSRPPNTAPYNIGFLPKLYIGVNAGFAF